MKNPFITSIRQRNFILISIVIAIIFAFFPVVSVPIIGSINLFTGTDGVLTLLAFGFSLIFILFWKNISWFISLKTQKNINENIFVVVSAILLSLIIVRIIYIWQKFVFMPKDDSPIAQAIYASIGIEIGLYLTLFTIIFAIANMFCFEKIDIFLKNFLKNFQEIPNNSNKKPEENSENNTTKTETSEENIEKAENHDN